METSIDGISDHGGSSVGGDKRPRDEEGSDFEDNTAQTSKSRGAVTVQIFIKKTYKMINDSDPSIAAWTPEGDKFIIKDPDRFANEVIPQYFDHNKFSSFTRQLNFYKFTREQSKVIKKSDNSSDIAKHQTFHHKYFQRGRPDLLTHLQRSKKTDMHGEEGGNVGHFKKQKVAAAPQEDNNKTMQEQLYELMQKSQRMEQKVHALEQENNKLSLSVQTLQHQDEMKQRAVLQLEEQIRRLELQLTNAFQQMQQSNQPLPFGRESSLSAVNASALMRYLSLGGSSQGGLSGGLSQELSRGISRMTTPPRAGPGPTLSRLTTPPRSQLGQAQNQAQQQRHFNAAAAAESLVANEAAASNNSVGAPSLPRHPEMKQFGASADSGATNAGASAGGGGGPSLPRHPRVKQFGGPADGAAGGGSGGGGATLPRHPRMKQFGGNGPTEQNNFPSSSIPTGFNNNPVASRNNGGEQNQGNGNNVGASGNTNFDNSVTREESFGISSLLDLARGSSLPI